MPTIHKSTDLFKFGGLKKDDILLCRTFDFMPAEGVNLDMERSIDDEIFRVVQLLENSIGEINNLIIEYLVYCEDESDVDYSGYQIYADTFVRIEKNLPGREYGYYDFKEYMDATLGGKFVNCNVNPNGDLVRKQIFGNECPAECDKGWLRNGGRLQELLPNNSLPPLPEFRPLCPVCYGQDVTEKQTVYRAMRQRDRDAHLPDWPHFKRYLAHRRWILGYYHACSCIFCTLPLSTYPHPENHRQAVDMYYETFEYHAVTTPVDRPTSEKAIDALPRKAFADADTEDTQCTVCQNDFSGETLVVQLPCKHVICETGCVEWLRHQNSCPVCRHKLASARDEISSRGPGAAGNVANARPLTFEEMAGLPPIPPFQRRYHEDDVATLSQLQRVARTPTQLRWVDPEIQSEDLYFANGGGGVASNTSQARPNFVARSNEARAIRRHHGMPPAHSAEAARIANEAAIADGGADMDDDSRANWRPRNGSMASDDYENPLLAPPGYYGAIRAQEEEMIRRARWEAGQRESVRGPIARWGYAD